MLCLYTCIARRRGRSRRGFETCLIQVGTSLIISLLHIKMKSDKYLFMRNISRIINFPDCRNFGMLNYRTVVYRTRPITHDVHASSGQATTF